MLPSGNSLSSWFSALNSQNTTHTGAEEGIGGGDSAAESAGALSEEEQQVNAPSCSAAVVNVPGEEEEEHDDILEHSYVHVHREEGEDCATETGREMLSSGQSTLLRPELPWRQTHEFFRHIGDKVSSLGQRMSESVKTVILGARQYDALSILTSELLPMLEQEAGDKSRLDVLTSLRRLHQHNDKFEPDESILLGANLNGKRGELLQRTRDLHHFAHFAVASYGWRGALFSRVFRSTLQKHEWTRFKNVLGNAMGTDKDFFSRLTGIKHEDILFESKEHPTYGLPKHWLVVDHSHKAIVLSIRGTATAADALTDAVSRNKGFIDGSEAHEGFAVSAHALYASMFSSEGLCLHKWLSKFQGYKLVLCGHSLGGGVAILLCALIYHFRSLHTSALGSEHARDVPLYGVEVTCYAYGPPPVMAPASKYPADAVENTFVFINGEDCVPRMSLRSVRDLVKLLSFLCDQPLRESAQSDGETAPWSRFDRVITTSVLEEMDQCLSEVDPDRGSAGQPGSSLTPLQIPGSKIYLKLSDPLHGISDEADDEETTSQQTTDAELEQNAALCSSNKYSLHWEKHKEHIHRTLDHISTWFRSTSTRRNSAPQAGTADQAAEPSGQERLPPRETTNATKSFPYVENASCSTVNTDEGLSLGRDVTKFLGNTSNYRFAWLAEPSENDFPELIVRTCAVQEHMPFSYLEALFQLQQIVETACTL
eukprot:gb/GECG01000537.1/.p1 GENE.gb/GECG01000537.1/~~gb/GECG01000537.1/.p1  ORF type:complete len:711 (+),score=90.67 gb/GECG01000537.1/:1-2133(+)